jgi:putative heme degradation protein
MDRPEMAFRLSRTLKFWVEVECNQRDINPVDHRQVAKILREFEQCGDAMRSLNRRGQVVWKASPQMVERLAAAEQEVEAEWKNEM